MIDRVKTLHEAGFLHRDIKPENFMMGLDEYCHTCYIIDFGLCKLWRDPVTGLHIPFADKKQLTGTARYTSINTHLGYEQSRRDDLEAVSYMLIYFLNGVLPWQGLPSKTKEGKYA